MNNFILIKILLFLFAVVFSMPFNLAQTGYNSTIQWKELRDGLFYAEVDAPVKSRIGDSKITILKIVPAKSEFRLLCASEYGKKTRTATEWAEEFNLEIVVNAGMYNPLDNSTSKSFMKNYDHINNGKMNPAYNSMLCFNPKDSNMVNFLLSDLKCSSWDSLKNDFNSYAQELRMIDCDRQPLPWNKNATQECSMIIVANDTDNNMLLIFCRSPYTHNTMIKFLLELPLDIVNASYLEGGPEVSMLVSLSDFKLERIGSYVSGSHADDDNDHFWKLPNVIGIKKTGKTK